MAEFIHLQDEYLEEAWLSQRIEQVKFFIDISELLPIENVYLFTLTQQQLAINLSMFPLTLVNHGH